MLASLTTEITGDYINKETSGVPFTFAEQATDHGRKNKVLCKRENYHIIGKSHPNTSLGFMKHKTTFDCINSNK